MLLAAGLLAAVLAAESDEAAQTLSGGDGAPLYRPRRSLVIVRENLAAGAAR